MYRRMKRPNLNMVSMLFMIIQSKQLGKIQLKSAEMKKGKDWRKENILQRTESKMYEWCRHVGRKAEINDKPGALLDVILETWKRNVFARKI